MIEPSSSPLIVLQKLGELTVEQQLAIVPRLIEYCADHLHLDDKIGDQAVFALAALEALIDGIYLYHPRDCNPQN